MNQKNDKKNPPVLKATKMIPRHKRAGKWIKKHKREIILSLEGVAALVIQYWWYRRRLMKMNRDFAAMTSEAQKSSAAQLGGAVKMFETAGTAALETQKQQLGQAAKQKELGLRLKALEETLKDPQFRKFLKEKHGLTDLKKVKK
jgi:hypothetical protein